MIMMADIYVNVNLMLFKEFSFKVHYSQLINFFSSSHTRLVRNTTRGQNGNDYVGFINSYTNFLD